MSKEISLTKSENGTLTLMKGSVLFASGDPSPNIYLVKTGQVVLLKESSKHLIPEAIVNEKEFLCDEQLFSSEKQTHTAMATEYTEVVVIKKSEIQTFFKTAPDWVANIMKIIAGRLNNSLDIVREHNIVDEVERMKISISKEDHELFLASLAEYRTGKKKSTKA